jgi:hypothetical protein
MIRRYLIDQLIFFPEVLIGGILTKGAIEHFESEERNIIITVIDSLLRDAKAKKAYLM